MSDFNNNWIHLSSATVQPIILSEYDGKNISVDVLRLDKIHPVISGNKWFKLKYYLQEARGEKQSGAVLTFGGAWSNHIIATAFMAKLYGLHSIGVIRGERPFELSVTLQAAKNCGMSLEFISRELYSQKNEDAYLTFLKNKFGHPYVIPEGGAGLAGIKGSEEILSLVEINKYSHIICCIGTATMYQGLLNASLPGQQVIGIPVLKGITYPQPEFTEDLKMVNRKIINEYHFGGYAKKTPALIQFMNRFYRQTGIPSDFVYTGKLLFGCTDLVIRDYFAPGSQILIIHSGGLQGNASLPAGALLF